LQLGCFVDPGAGGGRAHRQLAGVHIRLPLALIGAGQTATLQAIRGAERRSTRPFFTVSEPLKATNALYVNKPRRLRRR
jgi:hypothetical protein